MKALWKNAMQSYERLLKVMKESVNEGLKSFFGLEHTVKLKVKVNTLSKDDNPKRQRVM